MGQAQLGGNSVRPADPAGRIGRGRPRDHRRPRLGYLEGMAPLSLAGVDHQRRPQADRGHVHPARDGDAAARLHRCDHDAVATGSRVPVPGLSAARALRPDLLGSRHADDLLRRDALRHRADELRRAAAARGPRRRVPHTQLGRLLAYRHRCAAGQYFAGRWRIRADRVAAVSAALRADLLARRRRRLLPLVARNFRCGDLAGRHQPHHHGPQASRARHDLHAHADVLLDDARLQPADRRGLPHPHGDADHAGAGPLPRFPLFHQRSRRQHDDVHEPHLGVGTSGGLHPHSARLRRILGGGLDVLRQAAVRLSLDGRRDNGHLYPFFHGLAAPLLHDGRRRRRQRDLRHHCR